MRFSILLFTLFLSFCTIFSQAMPACAAEEVPGELLLTVAPCPEGQDKEAYLDDIAASADAYVVRVYAALSMTDEDPILLLIRSDTSDTESMMKALESDKRVYSASPNRIMRLRPPKIG